MIMNNQLLCLLVILLTLLTACVSPDARTSDPIQTAALQSTQASAVPLTHTATPALPPFFIMNFLDTSQDQCELPCWQGLKVGQSSPQDVERMFEETFHFTDASFLFEPDYMNRVYLPVTVPADSFITGYMWEDRTPLWLTFSFAEDTAVLEGIDIAWWSQHGDYHVHSPQEILSVFGPPMHIFVSDPRDIVHAADRDRTLIQLLIIYQEGLSFSFSRIFVPILIQEQGNTGMLCLGSGFAAAEIEGKAFTGSSSITGPIPGDLTQLTAVQYVFIGKNIEDNLLPIDEVFDTTLSDIIVRVQSEEDVCIYTR
jgi:hypothetical protein